jgi:SAM-dependent methyltransferase
MSDGVCSQLVREASACYRSSGRFAWHFARGKLAGDPVYPALLAQGLLAGRSHIVDLGCGQGLLAAWLFAASALHDATPGIGWPPEWPAPPKLQSYTGVEINAREVARARRAFMRDYGGAVRVVHGDIRDVDYAAADAVVILDVLHYLDHHSQERVLRHARRALGTRGLLLLRIGDAAAGAGFRFGKALDQTVALLRRRRWVPLAHRPLIEWQRLLEHCGFAGHAVGVRSAAPFADVLLQGVVA